MSWTALILRSALIGLTLVQAVLLPRGCCCAAERLTAVLSGDHSDLPACCRLAEKRARGHQDNAGPVLVDGGGHGHAKCQCVVSVCGSPQNQSPQTAEAASHERMDRWQAALPVLMVSIARQPMRLAKEHPEWDLASRVSGQDACILLQSWRC